MPFFSIIIPVYKVEHYLRECIESVLAQTFFNYECILIDDGSPDNCPKVCDEYVKNNKHFKVIHQSNRGPSTARNNGIAIAEGEYLVFLDADDIFVCNTALYNLFKIINKNNTHIIYHSNIHCFSENEKHTTIDTIAVTKTSFTILSFLKEVKRNRNMLLAVCSFTIQYHFFHENNLYFKEDVLHEDEYLAPRLLSACENITVNHNLFYGYRRQRPGSTMFTITSKRLSDLLVILTDLLSISKKEKVQYKKNIYAFFCKNNWLYIFTTLSKLGDVNQDIKNRLHRGLNQTVSCILNPMDLKSFLFFLFFKLLGITNIEKLYLFLRKWKKI